MVIYCRTCWIKQFQLVTNFELTQNELQCIIAENQFNASVQERNYRMNFLYINISRRSSDIKKQNVLPEIANVENGTF